jgi:glycosyltransferase involved in cell wall biosynthesis
MKPFVSIVVVCYNMKRELPRTLFSMSPEFQIGVGKDDYEVILVDNGSKEPPTAEDFAHLKMNLSVYSMKNPTHSPVRAINFGINQSIGQFVGVCIDGARLVSPGLIAQARDALTLYPRGVVAARGRYLGVKFQRDAMNEGYDAQQEDALLAQCEWKVDGYRLFDISVFDESCGPTWLTPMAESNALFMSRHLWSELQGFDEQFVSRGGGLVNLDTWRRAVQLPDVTVVSLMGEATFHQIHGGVATNGTHDAIREFFAEYQKIRGVEFEIPNVSYSLFGQFNHKVRGSELHPKSTKVVTKKLPLQKLRNFWAKSIGKALPSSARRSLRSATDIAGALLSIHPIKGLQKLKTEQHHARILDASIYFDGAWYALTYPDVVAAGYQPSVHYVRYGFTQRRQPGPYFDAVWYCDAYEDVVANGENPLLHYIHFGEAEGRRKRSIPTEMMSENFHEQQLSERNLQIIQNSSLFDADWYLNQYPDVAQSESEPIKHFLLFGGFERRNPSPLFDTAMYLQLHSDVKQTGLNPLLHFELHGRHEGRKIFAVPEAEKINVN